MRAHVGDRVVVDGHHVGDAPRQGEILEILSGREMEHYRVRWDVGGESILFPQSDTVVIAGSTSGVAGTAEPQRIIDLRLPLEDTTAATSDDLDQGSGRTAPESEARDTDLVAWFDEDDRHTEARISIRIRDYELTGFGRAARNPRDTNVPAVGEELAAARAMSDLAHQLLDLATHQLEMREGRPIHMEL